MAENESNLKSPTEAGRSAEGAALIRGSGESGDTDGVEMPTVSSTPKTQRRGLPRLVFAPILVMVLLAAGYFGYGYLQDQANYVSTENAQVSGALVQVGSLNAGRVSAVAVDVGDRVSAGQTVATVMLPSVLNTTADGTPKLGFLGTDDQTVEVSSPIDGVVVSRQANPGDTVPAGQALVVVVDPSQLWVESQIEENKVDRVRVGQVVSVKFDSLDKTLSGRVAAVNEATSGAFSLLPRSNTSSSFTKVTQLVPVKIGVDYGQARPVLGSSVEVKIRVQD